MMNLLKNIINMQLKPSPNPNPNICIEKQVSLLALYKDNVSYQSKGKF